MSIEDNTYLIRNVDSSHQINLNRCSTMSSPLERKIYQLSFENAELRRQFQFVANNFDQLYNQVNFLASQVKVLRNSSYANKRRHFAERAYQRRYWDQTTLSLAHQDRISKQTIELLNDLNRRIPNQGYLELLQRLQLQ